MKLVLLEYVIALGIFLVVVGGLSKVITGDFRGALIDSRNKVSLSRFQMLMWSALIIPMLFAVGVHFGDMNIQIPDPLLALLGISLGTGAGALIVNSNKAGQDPKTDLPATADGAPKIRSMGVLVQNSESAFARFVDMFKGEEIVDHQTVDISKVQLFMFTLAAVFGYVFALWNWQFAAGTNAAGVVDEAMENARSFPMISGSLVTLIGISHAGYLTIKATPKTPTQ